MMNKALQWLYDNWMKATPFLAIYSAILIWMYVKDVNYALTEVNIISIIVGIIAQASMMVYGFGYLVPKIKKEGLRAK